MSSATWASRRGGAARLFGAAATLRERLGTPLPPVVQTTHDRAVAAARAALGEDAFERLWTAGQALTPDEAITEALQESAPALFNEERGTLN